MSENDQPRGGTERKCGNCGSTENRLVRMDDRIMPTPKQFECIDCIQSRQADTDWKGDDNESISNG